MNDEIEMYLVDLLTRFVPAIPEEIPEEIRARDRQPLALLLHTALEAPAERRPRIFRHLGDFALYIAGFFADSLSSSLVDVDYYIAMGGRAYSAAGDGVRRASGGEALAEIFGQLSTRFGDWVELFDEVSEAARPRGNRDILRLYERYLLTRSERLRGKLIHHGLLPVDDATLELQ
ncbi:MAG: hypothetical protein KC466_03540, partial [Myxococcales bacterium]|nr:hypothetical protein [Myxococcales bacterium]